MRICLLELMPFPYTVGGGTTILIELSRALVEKGHEVHVISGKPGNNQPKLKIDKRVNIHNVGTPHRIFDNKGILSLPAKLIHRLIFEVSYIFGTRRVLKEINPDVCNPQSLITTSLPCSLFGYKFVATLQGPYLKGFRKLWKKRGSKMAILGSYVYEIIEGFNARMASKIIGTGKETCEYYSRYNSCKVIPNGVDIDEFSIKNSKRHKKIVSIGRLTEQKAVDKLILAMDDLKDYNLVVGGLGPLEPRIKKMCKERKNCKFIGYQSHDKLPGLLNKVRFSVFPSLFEGLPLAMLEQMSCGVIPISTPVGDILDVIDDGKNGFILKTNDPKAIAKKIRESEKMNLGKIAKQARKTAEEKYSWSIIADKFIKEYNEVVKN